MKLNKFIDKQKEVDEKCHLLQRCTFEGPSRISEYKNKDKLTIVNNWGFEEFKVHYKDLDMVGLKADHLGRLYVDYGQGKRCNHINKIRINEETIGGEEENIHWVCAYCGVRVDEV